LDRTKVWTSNDYERWIMAGKHKSKKELRAEAERKRRAGSMGSEEAEDKDHTHSHRHEEPVNEENKESNIWCGVEGLECVLS
jgi:hypothetical protein